MKDKQCYSPNCAETPQFALSWRIRDAQTRIRHGDTNTVLHACATHVDGLRDACKMIFRDAP